MILGRVLGITGMDLQEEHWQTFTFFGQTNMLMFWSAYLQDEKSLNRIEQ